MLVTELGLGGVGIGGGRTTGAETDESVATIQRALDVGMNYVDTSPSYGRGESEARIGIAFARMGGRPKGLYISTKTATHPRYKDDYSAQATRWTVENSLKILGVDSVDLLLIHTSNAYLPSVDALLVKGGTLDELDKLRDEGKFRWMGLAIREHDKIRQIIRTGRIDAILTFGAYSLVRQTAASLIDECYDQGVGVVLGFVYMAGLLAGGDPAERVKRPGAIPERLYPFHLIARDWWLWARERGVSLRSVALQYGLRNSKIGSVVVGCATPEHVDESLSAAYEPLSSSLWEEIQERIRRQND
jgi:aryl-alcohol dehydrogenase-like predicted oxidoreductase